MSVRPLPRPPPVRVSPLVLAAALAVAGAILLPAAASGAERTREAASACADTPRLTHPR